MIWYLAWKWGQQFCIWKWMGLAPGVAWTSASMMLISRIVASVPGNLYPANWHLFICSTVFLERYDIPILPISIRDPKKIIYIHCGQNRWLATPKRWRSLRGHDKPIYRSYVIYFPGGTPLKFNIAPKNRQSQKETHLPTIIFQGLC